MAASKQHVHTGGGSGAIDGSVSSVREALRAAVEDADSARRLRVVAERFLQDGMDREVLVAELEAFRTELLAAGRDDEDDAVLDLLDFVTGWCSPHQRL